MKVIQILPELDSGGVERGTLELAQHLVHQGHTSIVISGGGRQVAALENAGSRHITLPVGRKRLSSLLLVPKLRRILLEEKPDIVHLRSRVPGWLIWLAWRGMDRSTRPHLVSTVHGFNSVNRYSKIMTCGERVICVSESIRDFVRAHYPDVPAEKLRVVPRGVDPVDYPHGWQPDAAWQKKFVAEFPETQGKILLTLPGRVTRLKGHEEFFQLLDALRDLPVQGLVAGGAHPKKQAYLAELQQAARERKLPVTFTGNRSDLKNILAVSAVVYSFTTQPESFGRTTLEALSLGVPVIGYDHGGVGEQLAVIFPLGAVKPGDWRGAADKTRQFLTARPTVPAGHPFTLQAMLDGTLAVYQELLASPR